MKSICATNNFQISTRLRISPQNKTASWCKTTALIFFSNFFGKPLDFSLWVHYNMNVPTKKGGEYDLGIQKGTKLTDTPKDRTLKIRFDADTDMKLNAVCSATGKTKAQVIREGIDKLYAEIQKK